jgi:NAD(P)H dehydrogenase (quinone)
MHAPPKPSYPIFEVKDLADYDAFLFGIPTRYGSMPAQWKAFWDATGQIWATGALHGKCAGLFVSTGSQGGGQEATALAMITTLGHHGILYVPVGYKHTFAAFMNAQEVHGGGPLAAGTFAVRCLVCFRFAPCLTWDPGRRRFAPTYGA